MNEECKSGVCGDGSEIASSIFHGKLLFSEDGSKFAIEKQYSSGDAYDNSCLAGTVKVETTADCFNSAAEADGFVSKNGSNNECFRNSQSRPSGCYVNVDANNEVCFNTITSGGVDESSFPDSFRSVCRVPDYDDTVLTLFPDGHLKDLYSNRGCLSSLLYFVPCVELSEDPLQEWVKVPIDESTFALQNAASNKCLTSSNTMSNCNSSDSAQLLQVEAISYPVQRCTPDVSQAKYLYRISHQSNMYLNIDLLFSIIH